MPKATRAFPAIQAYINSPIKDTIHTTVVSITPIAKGRFQGTYVRRNEGPTTVFLLTPDCTSSHPASSCAARKTSLLILFCRSLTPT